MPSPASFDLILVGFGNVARRFVRLLDEQRDRLTGDYGLSWRISGMGRYSIRRAWMSPARWPRWRAEETSPTLPSPAAARPQTRWT
jgi:homoserine dehydrogenase